MVRRQADTGIDVLTDGEIGRVAFSWYATERLSGFDGAPRSVMQRVETLMFPEYYESLGAPPFDLPACNGPIAWVGPEYIQQDIANLKRALGDVSPEEAFMPCVSPGQIWLNFSERLLPDDEEFVMAAASALRNEYRAIVEAGFVLQLDDPGLAMGWNRMEFKDRSLDDYRKVLEQHVEAITSPSRDSAPTASACTRAGAMASGRTCATFRWWKIVDILYRVNAEGLSVEGSNPRHAHEWSVFQEHPLPEGKVLIPGVIDTVTNFVEHPDLVAETHHALCERGR